MARNSMFTQFQSLGEEALARLAQNPTAHRMVQSAMELKERVDELTRRVRGLESMEHRLDELEHRVAVLEGGESASPPEPESESEPPALPESPATATDSTDA